MDDVPPCAVEREAGLCEVGDQFFGALGLAQHVAGDTAGEFGLGPGAQPLAHGRAAVEEADGEVAAKDRLDVSLD
jgi:hypothetical protein